MANVKQVGSSGQISLGKRYASRTVQVIEDEAAQKITLVFGRFVPSSEQWLHQEPDRDKLDEAIRYAETTPPSETDLETLKNK